MPSPNLGRAPAGVMGFGRRVQMLSNENHGRVRGKVRGEGAARVGAAMCGGARHTRRAAARGAGGVAVGGR